MLARGEHILSQGVELARDLQLMGGLDVGELTVSASVYPAELSAHRAVGRLIRAHPNIRCRVKVCDWRRAASDVRHREADLALAETSEAAEQSQLATRLVGSHRLVFFCRPGHPLASGNEVSLDDVLAYPWVSTRAPMRMTRSFPKNLRAAGWIDGSNGDFVSAIQVAHLTAGKHVVADSNAIGAAPPVLIDKELNFGALVELPLSEPWLHLNYGFIYLRDRTLSPAAEAFIREVETVEAELAARQR